CYLDSNPRMAGEIRCVSQGSADNIVVKFSARSIAQHSCLQRPVQRISFQVTQQPVTLGATLEFSALRLRAFGVGQYGKQFIGLVGRLSVVGKRCKELALKNQVHIAANRRTELRVTIQSDAGMERRVK